MHREEGEAGEEGEGEGGEEEGEATRRGEEVGVDTWARTGYRKEVFVEERGEEEGRTKCSVE